MHCRRAAPEEGIKKPARLRRTVSPESDFWMYWPKIGPKWLLPRFHFLQKSKKNPGILLEYRGFYGCGGRTRTYDLRVMSPTSYRLLYSAIWGASLDCLSIIPRCAPVVNRYFFVLSGKVRREPSETCSPAKHGPERDSRAVRKFCSPAPAEKNIPQTCRNPRQPNSEYSRKPRDR